VYVVTNMSVLVFWFVTPHGLVGSYSGRKISVSLNYVTVRGEGKMERGSKTPCALSLLLPP
jgi:hypothetical protein